MVVRCVVNREIVGEGEEEREVLKIAGIELVSGDGVRFRVVYDGSRYAAGARPFVEIEGLEEGEVDLLVAAGIVERVSGDDEDVAGLLAAAVARWEVYPGSKPEWTLVESGVE